MLLTKTGGVNGKLKRLDSPLFMQKKGVLKITPEAKEKLLKIKRKHEYTVGDTFETLNNHILNKVVEGDYDFIKPIDTRNSRKVNVDYDIWEKAKVKAEELGFTSLNQMMNQIADVEFLSHLDGIEHQKAFETVGNTKYRDTKAKYIQSLENEQNNKALERGLY
ncbi:hypothetical protein [Staphylococcus warneri]|uniref:hypothetical protein n=1 Tax=Staphylococcus warneri TaxID=1292 RepID=UPI000735F057|nr:hypothetical protein [Staphylococcus warneri]KTW22869.1 hypothetical protein SA10R_07020 [Staphylococcus warneri]MCJ1788041.1 hypothetical protein [Staphylococcus warneri]MCJ1792948.1 hypothetical protein [Staphylococcus warneri]MCJ1795410.1 hypothetical protein [Staphylococcus warneri]MCJ1797851.1 hypothetical protein [Staphylococcus warneri]